MVDLGALSNSADLDLFVSAYMTYVKNITYSAATDRSPLSADLSRSSLLDNLYWLPISSENLLAPICIFKATRMAPLAEGGVVDSSGRVYGVTNLFVADNSVPQDMDGSSMDYWVN